MQILLKILHAWLLLWMLILFTACGGNGSDDDSGISDSDNTDNTTAYYTVSGQVTGLNRGDLILLNNGEGNLAISADGSFYFETSLADGSAYAITIASQSSDQVCSVLRPSGILAGADVDDVLVSCLPDKVTPTISSDDPKLLNFTWNDVSANHYKLLKNPDGNSGYSQIGHDVNGTAIQEEISVHLMDWANASYIVQACNIIGDCSDSTPITATSFMLDMIGFLKEPSIGLSNNFGHSTALSGDGTTLAVGAVGVTTVYLFELSGANWIPQAEITRSSDRFGHEVSLSSDGSTLAVSAVHDASSATGINGEEDDSNAPNSGAVYIFTRSGDTWNQQAYIKASNAESSDLFGMDVSLSGSGDILAVASTFEESNATGINGDQFDNSAPSSGAAYLFERSHSVWRQKAYIKASNAGAGDWFGRSLQLSNDGATLAVGAPKEKYDTTRSGAVYVFVSEGDSWAQQALIKASNEDRGDYFGYDVALSADGNSLAVGAWAEGSYHRLINAGENDNSLVQAGAAYVFKRNGVTWSQEAYIKSSNTDNADHFGFKVVLSADGNLLAVSAKGEDSIATGINGDQTDNTAYDAGAVYLFKRNGITWSRQSYIKAPNTGKPYVVHDYGDLGVVKEQDGFGETISLSSDGSLLVVGAPREASSDHNLVQDDDSAPSAGAVYLY